ncbi:hypothetical protein MH928_17205 [Flavobacterium sp. WW92]|uniref:hypothetical protein n=1 Tax=unclassified Flavobacterium TaxID=196869 RepID=UPI0022255EA5|nr:MULTISPECIES: hypothetical protein [unclassified Flavobacterium]WDO13046.1 hypothetical protein MH928_17205 [Flavobacterium sp. WW92]
MARKKLIFGLLIAAGAAYYFTRKNKDGGGAAAGTTFQLAELTNPLWTNGVGVSIYDANRGWGTTTQLLVEKAGNEQLLNKITNGTKLKLEDGTVVTAENILDLNIDQYYRISTYEDISGLVSVAGFPKTITIV